ncbi:hypothetical protein D0B54_23910 [Solimonas sp. K1W22B-7]|uniref:hypothetical protein n=1 Tax=Solimonas sp. K1W22B-7 TaxID=2303331 RepID=UPI000E336687|nr:hypothetical protein [Solimonas sp. K1W22B-7]AXQ31544.1 hypothetical protein D0B54_23910 [Solimonas sp. K1W22B-7]
MIKKISPAMVAGSVVLLSACGGGGGDGGDGGDGGSAPVQLESKADALRELTFAGTVINVVVNNLPDDDNADTARAKRHGHGNWGVVDAQRLFGPRQRAKQACPGGGKYVYESSTRNHSFDYFSGVVLSMGVTRETGSHCRMPGTGEQGEQLTTEYQGVLEDGRSGTLNDGSRYGYLLYGAGSEPYDRHFEVRDGNALLYREDMGLRGRVEARIAQDGAVDFRTVYHYDLDANSYGDKFSADVRLGSGTTAFRQYRTASALIISGPYQYRISGCQGGLVTASTPQAISLGEQGYPAGGSLRLVSGNSSVQFDFDAAGGATLELNGVQQTLTPQEVRAALTDSEPC